MSVFIRGCAITVALAGFVGAVHAQELVDFSGTYRASARETRVEVTTWGEHCGPRPQSATEPAGESVDVRSQGAHLALAFPDRNVRTDACWSPNPMVRVTSAVATTARWRTECATPSGDAKQERGVYTISAPTRDSLELVDESSYDWQLKQSHCVAKVRITQRLQRAPSAPSEEPALEPEPAGCVPGALARLRLRPQETRIAPGERVCFAVRALDAAGCTVPLAPGALKWTLLKPEAIGGALTGNCFKAANTAAEGEGRFQVVVTTGALREEAVISVVPADLSDITARRGAGSSASELASERARGIMSELGIDAVVRSSSEGLLIAALLAMMIAVVGFAWFLFARARQRAAALAHATSRSRRPEAAASRPAQAALQRASEIASSSGSAEQLICPTCRRGYSGGAAACPRDGTPLIPYAEFLRRAQEEQQVATTCPACGTQLAPGAVFCGGCGQKVRP